MADKVHRRPVAPGGFTQAPLTSTAVWRGITNSLATTAAQISDATPGLLAKASASTKVVLEQNRQLWIDPLSEAVQDITGDAKAAFRPGGAGDAAAALRADARGNIPDTGDSLTSSSSGGGGQAGASTHATRPSPSAAAPVRDASRARGHAARKLDAIFSALDPGDEAVVAGGLNEGRGFNRRGGASLGASLGARGGAGTSRDAAAPIAVDVETSGEGTRDGLMGERDGRDPSVSAAFASIASLRNRSIFADVDRSSIVFWGCVACFLAFSAVVAWRKHVASAGTGEMEEEDLDGGGVRRRLLELVRARLASCIHVS